MKDIYIYALIGFVIGTIITIIAGLIPIARLKKLNKSLSGFLESEKLRKETHLKENNALHELKRATADDFDVRLKEVLAINKRLNEDILLLQKSNEETETLLEAGFPVVHTLKLQLIEANNAIARYKAQLARNTAENVT